MPLVRELDVADVRVVLRTSSESLLESLDQLLSVAPTSTDAKPVGPVQNVLAHTRETTTSDLVHVDLREGRTALALDGTRMDVSVASGDLPGALRGILGLAMDQRGGALLHGAGIVIDRQAILCIAPSEGGKTTLCGKLDGRTPVLSDETVALRLDGPRPRIGGTPFWSGPELPSADGLFPLAAICFLRKGGEALLSLARPQALSELLLEWHLPERPGATADALSRANALISQLPLFTLRTTLEGDPLPLLRKAAQTDAKHAG